MSGERHDRSMETEAPLDLSALAPLHDTPELDALVARVMHAAEPELRRRASMRRGGNGLLAALAGWSRPILSAAAVVALLSTGALGWDLVGSAQAEEAALLPELLGLPSTVAAWLDEDRAPTTRELILAMEDGEGWR